ncbi:unnamed protein product, partial [Hapterophycus canaliculatus]
FSSPVSINHYFFFCGQVALPLDFSTIKKRQKRGRYAKLGFSKLWEDIGTVYHNAQLYNQVRLP